MGEQLSMMPEHRIEPPDCYDEIEEMLDQSEYHEDEDYGTIDMTVDVVADGVISFVDSGISREDIERCIRIYRERKEANND